MCQPFSATQRENDLGRTDSQEWIRLPTGKEGDLKQTVFPMKTTAALKWIKRLVKRVY